MDPFFTCAIYLVMYHTNFDELYPFCQILFFPFRDGTELPKLTNDIKSLYALSSQIRCGHMLWTQIIGHMDEGLSIDDKVSYLQILQRFCETKGNQNTTCM